MVVGTMLCLASCGSAPLSRNAPPAGVVTYYDQNGDGVVDAEYHDVACCDRSWGLFDTNFDGRFDLKLTWGWGTREETFGGSVPTGVKMSTDFSAVPGWPHR
jgi:hypothetical protein